MASACSQRSAYSTWLATRASLGFSWVEGSKSNGWHFHEDERVAEEQVSFSADRRENQGARRLAGQGAQPAPYVGQGSRSRGRRGVEVARRSGVVARRTDLHR